MFVRSFDGIIHIISVIDIFVFFLNYRVAVVVIGWFLNNNNTVLQ